MISKSSRKPTVSINLSNEDEKDEIVQPVYVLPGGGTPVYDVNIGEQLEQYDYPQLESATSNRSSPTGDRQTRNSSIPFSTPAPTPTAGRSFDHETYEYPNPNSLSVLTTNGSPRVGRNSIDSSECNSTRLDGGRPSIVSIEKKHNVSIEVEDERLYEKLDESVGDDNFVRRESQPLPRNATSIEITEDEEDDDYVYEKLGSMAKQSSKQDQDQDLGEYVYAWPGVNDAKSLEGNSPPNNNNKQEKNDIYETFNENHSHSVPVGSICTPVPVNLPLSYTSNTDLKPSQSIGSLSSITQMPLPALPNMDGTGNHDNNNMHRPKGEGPVNHNRNNRKHSKEEPLIDRAGYTVLTKTSSKDDPAVINNKEKNQQRPKLGRELPIDQAGYLILTSQPSSDQYDNPVTVTRNHKQAPLSVMGSSSSSQNRSTSTSSSVSADSVEDAYEIMSEIKL